MWFLFSYEQYPVLKFHVILLELHKTINIKKFNH